MSETAQVTPATGSETAAKTRRSLAQVAAGGGDYLRAEVIPPRGMDVRVISAGWEDKYHAPGTPATEEVPCLLLLLSDGGDEAKFKITTKVNAGALVNSGVDPDTLEGAAGLDLFLQRVVVSDRSGKQLTTIQIAQVDRDGAVLFPPAAA